MRVYNGEDIMAWVGILGWPLSDNLRYPLLYDNNYGMFDRRLKRSK